MTATFASRLPSLAGASALVVALVFNLEASGAPSLGIYSYLKAGALLVGAAAAAYLSVSAFSARFRRLNNLAVYGIAFNLVLLEAAFRLFPSLLPADLVALLPAEARRQVAATRGLFTNESFQGEAMLFSFRPGAPSLWAFPWVRIDADGFRNPAVPRGPVEVVVFGDSVAFARHADKEIGEILRERGIAAYNLAMGGYGPFQYRDAYRRYVIDRGLRHRLALVLVSVENDFGEALRYQTIAAAGGDFREYLGESGSIGPSWPDRQPSWMLALAARFPVYLRSGLTDVSGWMNRLFGEVATAKFAYGSFAADRQLLAMPERFADHPEWQALASALDEMARLARGADARLVVVLLPGPSLLYRDSIDGLEDQKRTLARRYDALLRLFADRFAALGVPVVDLAEHMARGLARQPIVPVPFDYHYTTEGWLWLGDELVRRLDLGRGWRGERGS